MLKALLLWQKNEAIPQAQYGKRRTGPQTKVLAELLWDGKLSLLTDLGRRQIFPRGHAQGRCREVPGEFLGVALAQPLDVR